MQSRSEEDRLLLCTPLAAVPSFWPMGRRLFRCCGVQMKALWVAVLISAIPVVAQNLGPELVGPDPARKQIFNNDRVTAYVQEIPPSRSFATNNLRDTISVSINPEEKSVVELHPAGTAESIKNSGKATLRSVEVQFAEAIGPKQDPTAKRAHYCNDEDKRRASPKTSCSALPNSAWNPSPWRPARDRPGTLTTPNICWSRSPTTR